MIVGDTHGNTEWLRKYIFPMAMAVNANNIVVLGDFGAWEHTEAGTTFFNRCAELTHRSGIPLYWLHGNHDKYSHTLKNYKPDHNGFIVCRPGLLYIPQGHAWQWEGKTFRAFGGAYSVDRAWRVDEEQRIEQQMRREARLAKHYIPAPVTSQAGTLWFPEEEMTDEEINALLLADHERKDVILSHDKPYSARPDWNRKEIAACLPNQLRLEWALRQHKPKLWFHGHLHYHYQDRIQGGGFSTNVIGLEPDNNAAEGAGWRRENTWAVLDLIDGEPLRGQLGYEVEVSQEALNTAKDKLE